MPVSSVYDGHDSMDGLYDDNFYLKNPVDLHSYILVKNTSLPVENMAFQTKAGLISVRKQLFSLDERHFLLRKSAVLTKEHPVARETRRYYHHVSRFPY